jgi:tetratricopeptide (TPR) repeat protein
MTARAVPHASSPRLRLLLRVLALLALVSAGVNLYRWRTSPRPSATPPLQGEGLAARPGSRVTGSEPDSPPLVGEGPGERSALEQQQRWVAAHPGDAGARLALARMLFIARRFSEAAAHLVVLKTQQPRRAEIWYWLALAQKEEGQADAEARSLEQALRLEPHRALFRETLGEVYLAQGRSTEAARTFDACLKRGPASYSALMGKARAMEQLYEAKLPVTIPEIMSPVEKAVRLQPGNSAGLTVLARMAFAYMQQFDRADRLAQQAIELDPTRAEPYMIRVEIALSRPTPENGEQAVAWAREAARLDPGRPEPLYLLGRALLRRGDLNGAIEALERSTRAQLMPEAVYQLSLAYARAGNEERSRHYSRLYESWNQFVERRKVLLASLQHRSADVDLYARLAELYLSQGATEPARNWVEKGLQLCPADPRLHRLLSRTATQAGGDGTGQPQRARRARRTQRAG